MKHAGRFFGLAICACAVWTSGVRADVLAEYTFDAGDNFNPSTQGWTLGDETEEDVNFFNTNSNLLISESSGGPKVLFSTVVPANVFFDAWSFTGNNKFAGNSQEEFGMFMFADDGTNLWNISFYNHGNDDFDGIFSNGDPEGPVLSNTATKVFAEPVDGGFPGGSPENRPFDAFHDWALVDPDGRGGAPPKVQLNAEDVVMLAMIEPSPSRFPAGTVGWGTLNPFESGFFQTTHMVFEGNPDATPPSKPGDFDANDVVDGADFVLWQRNFGAPDESSLNGNGDGMNGVDQGDLTLWKSTFGVPSASVATAAPEPQSLAMLVGGAIALLSLRRRR